MTTPTTSTLIEAARAVVARWDSPNWADAAHTRDYIDALRAAIKAAESAQPVASSTPAQSAPKRHAHPDDAAVDRFAASMKRKLADKRAAGLGGWDDPDQCSTDYLARLLRDHVAKGDPVDVGNYAMMLFNRAARTNEGQQPATEPARQPMMDEQRMLLIMSVLDAAQKPLVVADLCMEITRAVEQFHEIGEQEARNAG